MLTATASIGTIVYLLTLHFLADFLLQSRDMGRKKSSDWGCLLRHTFIVFIVIALGTPWIALSFAFINTIMHGVQDAIIWRLYKFSIICRTGNLKLFLIDHRQATWNAMFSKLAREWKYGEDKWFYTTIGIDQLLHAATIILLYGWII